MLEAGLTELCASFGVGIEEFLPRIPARFREGAAIYLSGSLVEGFGNSTSDLDVMIVSGLPLDDVQCTIRKDFGAIDMILGRNRRIDLEYVDISWFQRPLATIAGLDIPVDFVAERLDEREELFIHRLIKGKALLDNTAYRQLREMVQEKGFRRYMVKRCLHKIDGAALDLDGLFRKGDGPDALMRLHDVMDLTVDSYRFRHGMTNPLPKWRIRSLSAIASTGAEPAAADILEFYLAHRVFRRIDQAATVDDIKAYARDVLYWSDSHMRHVYD